MTVKKRLGEMLIEAGVIDETQLHAALGHQRKWGGKLGQALLDLKLATEPQIVTALSRKFGYTAMNVAALPRTPQVEAALKLVPRELALRQTLLPVASDTSSITVVMADPSNIAVVDELSFRTGRRIKIGLAGDREIAAAVRRLYYADEEPYSVKAIPLEELSTDSPFEPVRDPFSAMPDYMRDGFPSADDATAARAQAHVSPTPAPPRPLPAPVPRSPASRVDVRAAPTPPPVLARGAAPAFTPVPGLAARPPTGRMPTQPRAPVAPLPAAAPEELLGEPILATDLAPAEDEEPSRATLERRLTPRQSAMLDALARVARGEESGLVKPGQLAAALALLLVRRGILTEQELLDELARK
jgi:MshEN domain